VKIEASSSYKLVGTWKNPVNCRSLVSTGLLIETKIKSMRHISTLFFYLVLLFSTVYAQDSSNSKIQGFKILNNQLPLTTSNSEPVVIRIRCLASNLNTEPLTVIDGVVAEKFELRNISPDDIESIWILKGTTATTLYGCRGWSGVIIITTKTANDRTIKVKDMLTGEIFASANVDLISMGGRKDTTHLITDSSGKIITNKIVYGKEYELTATRVGYKPHRCLINSKIIGKSYTVLLLKGFKTLSLVENQEPITAMCYNLKTVQSYELRSTNEPSSDQFRVFPIPAKAGSEIKIVWRKAPIGEYVIGLYNLQGQFIKSSFARIENETNAFSFQIPIVTPGSYLLQMTNRKSGKKYAEKILIQ
jgi:TonB-dependent SusC/RagA subfamily outer membrane receptor